MCHPYTATNTHVCVTVRVRVGVHVWVCTVRSPLALSRLHTHADHASLVGLRLLPTPCHSWLPSRGTSQGHGLWNQMA